MTSARVAVILPCYNEAAAIGATVAGFRAALPDATVYVYDNNSCDGTAAAARAAGAIVRTERMQGKGHVVRRMFADVDADVYVMADGDATYDAAAAPALVERLLDEQLDMVVGARRSEVEDAYRRGHRLGNALLTGMLARLFGRSFSDILSGYRVFSRRFVKSFPVLSEGFEIETEISVHALELRMPVAEVVTAYGARPEGSASKLSTWRDGWRILRTILNLFRLERPVLFFGAIGLVLLLLALGLAAPLVVTYARTGLVPRFPTAILVTGLVILATLNVFAGLILDTVVRGRREVRRLAYLALPAAQQVPLSTGARRLLDRLNVDDWDAAEDAYQAIREANGDVTAIAANLGCPPERVARIKEHVFLRTHQLDDSRRRFDADPAIVNAWSRLTEGNVIASDLAFLSHERFETKFEAMFATDYRTAHDAALRSGRVWTPGD